MKNKNYSLFITIVLLIFTGCKFQTPEKISVKTNAEYNFSLGNISNTFELDGFNTLAAESADGSQIYDYFPGEKDETVQEFLMEVPIEEIPIDFSSYFAKSDVALAIRELSFEKQINIPEINKNVNKEIDSVYVNNAINSLLTVSGTPSSSHLILFGSSNFTSITYTEGYFDISCPSIPDGTSVTLLSNGVQLTDTFESGFASFVLDDYTMKNDAQIWFSINSSLPYTGVIRGSSQVLSAEGVTTDVPVPVNQVIPMGDATSSLDNATIGVGQFVSTVGIPSAWTNVNCNYGINTSGAMSINSPATSDLSKTIDLAGKSIGSGDINFNSEVNLSFANSHISFEEAFEIDISCTISKFDIISINASDITTSLNRRDKFSASMLSAIKRLMLIQSGIKGTYVNTLPAGNDINVIANSQFFEMNNTQQLLYAGKTNEAISILSPDDLHKLIYVKDPPTLPNEYNGWDFDMRIELPGATASNPDRITLYSVDSGAHYEIKIDFKPELNWEYVVLHGNTAPIRREVPLGLSFKKLLDSITSSLGVSFTENFKLKSLPLYLMVMKPNIKNTTSGTDVFKDSKYKGSINIFYGKKVGSTVVKINDENGLPIENKLLGPELENNGIMTFVPNPERIIKENTIITDYSECEHSVESDIVELMNVPSSEEDSELYINYELNFTNDGNAEEIIITKEMYDNSDNLNSSITVNGIIVIPLKFLTPTDRDVDINFNEALGFGNSGDFFDREGATSEGIISDNFNVIESFSVLYTGNKIPIYSNPDVSLNITMFQDEKPISVKLREGKITVNSKEVDKLINEFPFSPQIDLHFLRASEISIARNMAFDMNLQLQLVTNGVISF